MAHFEICKYGLRSRKTVYHIDDQIWINSGTPVMYVISATDEPILTGLKKISFCSKTPFLTFNMYRPTFWWSLKGNNSTNKICYMKLDRYGQLYHNGRIILKCKFTCENDKVQYYCTSTHIIVFITYKYYLKIPLSNIQPDM